MTRRIMALALLLAMLPAAGCGREVVGGGQTDVATFATGDGTPEGGGAAPSRAPAYALSPGAPSATHIAGRTQGTITFEARVQVVRSDGARATVGEGTAMVRADGHDTTQVVRARVNADRYTMVRVTFTHVQANVTSGLVIGGVSVTGQVNVAVGNGVVVEIETDDLGAEEDEEDAWVLIDLDASAWLGAANPFTRVVPAAAFQNAVKIRTRV